MDTTSFRTESATRSLNACNGRRRIKCKVNSSITEIISTWSTSFTRTIATAELATSCMCSCILVAVENRKRSRPMIERRTFFGCSSIINSYAFAWRLLTSLRPLYQKGPRLDVETVYLLFTSRTPTFPCGHFWRFAIICLSLPELTSNSPTSRFWVQQRVTHAPN